MVIKIYDDKASLGRAAAEQAAAYLRTATQERGGVRIIAATGASQFEFLVAAWVPFIASDLENFLGGQGASG